MPQLPVGNVTFSLSGHKFEMSAPDLLVSLHPNFLHQSSVEEGRRLERAACAELVRAPGCICDSLSDSRAGREGIASYTPPFSRIVVHDPRCPQSLAARIEERT